MAESHSLKESCYKTIWKLNNRNRGFSNKFIRKKVHFLNIWAQMKKLSVIRIQVIHHQIGKIIR